MFGFAEKKDDALNPTFLSVNKRITANTNDAITQIFFFFTCFNIKLYMEFVNPATPWGSISKTMFKFFLLIRLYDN